jgi:hypothetical protein
MPMPAAFVTFSRRSLLAGMVALPASAPAQPTTEKVFTPEMFGAKGDGVTDDSDALAALGAAVSIHGGGTIRFRPVTYRVGRQAPSTDPGARHVWTEAPLLTLYRCHLPLTIVGNGARLKCADGLRYGTFNRDGTKLEHGMPYLGPGACTPYEAMITISECTGPVEVSGLELDGNLPRLNIGGQFGDTGFQIHALGLALYNNVGSEVVRDVHTHHHAQDGLYIDGLDKDSAGAQRRIMTNVRSDYNGRQGCSIVGGRGYVFERCQFNHTGRAGVASAPGCGVDIEAENKKNRGFRFVDCVFMDNFGCGLAADTGDSEDISFTNCRFIGTTSWSAWPNKPHMRFQSCSFVGAMCRAWGDTDPQRAAQFIGCTFQDDPRLSPTGKVFGGSNPGHPLVDLSDAQNVLFSHCRFLANHGFTLPWSTHAIYANCAMQQRSNGESLPRGTYLGHNVVTGHAGLYGSSVRGEVVLNGQVIRNKVV